MMANRANDNFALLRTARELAKAAAPSAGIGRSLAITLVSRDDTRVSQKKLSSQWQRIVHDSGAGGRQRWFIMNLDGPLNEGQNAIGPWPIGLPDPSGLREFLSLADGLEARQNHRRKLLMCSHMTWRGAGENANAFEKHYDRRAVLRLLTDTGFNCSTSQDAQVNDAEMAFLTRLNATGQVVGAKEFAWRCEQCLSIWA
eukprot:CAMPEP_0181191222 /NCGR_PEP_ID=MMETSP1096-20121128/12621_1 /TAXON_ID=156174 ORGANISM="Chrysochromulina ericina, Strain CCMP281" /NCGR_SAMPLE_ID=MMETSP1096 /ASSEMBLY_ACC=CAM_ASM_000453 /LENGTH=199 /DNA_ID=CAMNT_0023280509 /DNA_START=120 /DNA_END=719 /DNA_ORIENTATION=-